MENSEQPAAEAAPANVQVLNEQVGADGIVKNMTITRAAPGEPQSIAPATDGSDAAPSLPEGMSESTLDQLRAAGFQINAPTAAIEKEAAAVEEQAPTEELSSEDLDLTGDSEESTEDAPTAMTLESFADYSAEFVKNEGVLGDESREAIMKAHNIDSGVLDAVLRGIQSVRQENAAATLAEVGISKDLFKEAGAWSRANESDDARAVRTKMLQDSNPMVRKMAMESLIAASGVTAKGEPVHKRGSEITPAEKLSFQAYHKKAMADPRYTLQNQIGDQFRAEVAANLNKLKKD